MNAPIRKSKAQLLVGGGDPDETLKVIKPVGYMDGQTTNPTLIAKNPEVRRMISSGRKFRSQEELPVYKKIVRPISGLVGSFADLNTTAKDMVAQGLEMFSHNKGHSTFCGGLQKHSETICLRAYPREF